MSERLNDYFASEATEYLDQLDRLLALPGRPDADQLLRLSTGVRGSAQMAGAETVAGVAERLEDAARSIVSSNVAWSEELRELSRQTVGDLKLLVRALNRWGQEEERRVREAILRWEDLDEQAPEPQATAIPVSELFHDDAGPHVIEASREPDGRAAAPGPDASDDDRDVVSVGTLLFRGEDALREALRLRSRIDAAAAGAGDGELPRLLDELFDLVELGLEDTAPEG